MRWSDSDIRFELYDDATQDPVVTVEVWTPDGVLYILAEVEERDHALILKGVHLSGMGPNRLGPAHLRQIARAALRHGVYDEIIVEGAVRTTGANPGHSPKRIRFTR